MKKRLTKFAVLILLALGTVLACEIAEALLPKWAFISLGVFIVVYMLWDLSSPGNKYSYWYVTYMTSEDKTPNVTSAISKQEGGKFDFEKFESEKPNSVIIMIKSISEKQYNKLNELKEKEKRDMFEPRLDDMMPIPVTELLLMRIGFKPILPVFEGQEEYKMAVNDCFVEIRNGVSNSCDRDWYCHIDNLAHSTIGGFDFQYLHELQNGIKLITGNDLEVKL